MCDENLNDHRCGDEHIKYTHINSCFFRWNIDCEHLIGHRHHASPIWCPVQKKKIYLGHCNAWSKKICKSKKYSCVIKNNIVRSADPPIVIPMKWSCLAPDFRAMVIIAKAIKKTDDIIGTIQIANKQLCLIKISCWLS